MIGAAAPSPPTGNAPARRRAFVILAIVLLVAASAWLCYWLLFERHYETTDDAYVAGDVVQITSEVAGTVTAVRVDDTQRVSRGQPLVELDSAEARFAVAAAEAELARAVRDVGALFAQEGQLRAELAAREVALGRGALDLARREPLQADGAVSGEELAHAQAAVAELNAAVAAQRAQREGLAAQLQGTTVATHPRVLQAAAGLRHASLALRRTRLASPITGVVARRTVQIGERVGPGVPLMAVIALDDVWIDANFKEVQLRRIRVGQPVTIRADVYGGDVVFHGRVIGLAAGSGSAFALLPAQNASGNWIKIVQRLPVRIGLEPKEVAAHPLRVGLSNKVEIDVGDTSGPPIGGELRAALATSMDTAEDPAVEARIGAIIAANRPPAARHGTRRSP